MSIHQYKDRIEYLEKKNELLEKRVELLDKLINEPIIIQNGVPKIHYIPRVVQEEKKSYWSRFWNLLKY